MGMDLLTEAQKLQYNQALQDVFDTFARPFNLYIEAQTAVISTSLTYSRFGDHSQNTAINADNTALTPQVFTVTGCILYGNRQPWIDLGLPSDQQIKIKESNGTVRVKVDANGYVLMKQCKLVNLDGFDFQLNSNARPHGLVGQPTRWTFTLEKVD